jgi:hypothetical protein
MCASDFVSIEPSIYGDIPFSIVKHGTNKDTTLNVIQVKKLSSLISWFRRIISSPAVHWSDLSEDAFRIWRTESVITPATTATTITAPCAVSAINDFQKGVKRSISDYKPFKVDRYFNSWQRHLQTTARSRNLNNIINLSYYHVPSTQEEISLLEEQKKFVYSVLEQTVLTPDGILIIRVHSDTGDASAVYADLVDRYGRSTAAQLAGSELESDLAAFCIDATWTKTNLAFLIAWTTKTLDLDGVLEQPITESQKRIWFTCSVAPKAVLSYPSSTSLKGSLQLESAPATPARSSYPFSTTMSRMLPSEPISRNASFKTHLAESMKLRPMLLPLLLPPLILALPNRRLRIPSPLLVVMVNVIPLASPQTVQGHVTR